MTGQLHTNRKPWLTSLSVVIPCFNEELQIENSLIAISQKMYELKMNRVLKDYEILIINDGSTDHTTEIVKHWINHNKEKEARLIDNKVNQQKGGAVIDGLKAAMMDLVLFMDADLSTSLDEIERFIELMKINDYDLLIAERRTQKLNRKSNSIFRQGLSDSCIHLVHLMLPQINVCDTQCGFKMMTNELAHYYTENLKLRNFSFDIEMILLASLVGFKIGEVDVKWQNRLNGSKIDPVRVGIQMLKDLIYLRKTYLRGDTYER